MATPLYQKLKIKPKDILLTLNAPPEFKKELKELPAGVRVVSSAKDYNQVHWFVMNKAQMEKELGQILKLMKEGVICWIYYPKGSSKLQTDLTRDKGWDKLLKHDEFHWISLISFDHTWSTFAFRLKNEVDKKKQAAPPPAREIFNWVNPATKEVRVPDDLVAAFKKSKKAATFFDTLSFTNKKEYIEWIVTARREETRTERIKGTIERLEKNWKNPRNM
jgi:hypothetical protein